MGGRLRIVPGLILLVLAIPIVVVGLVWALYGLAFLSMSPCAPDVPVCRSQGPIVFVFAGTVVAIGIAHGIAGVGILRDSVRALVIGVLVSIGGLLFTADAALTAFRPVGSIRDDALGAMVPHYDNGKILIAAGVLPYGLSLILLLLALGRRHARTAGRLVPD